MADMRHAIEIEAPPEKVYEALTTSEGLRPLQLHLGAGYPPCG